MDDTGPALALQAKLKQLEEKISELTVESSILTLLLSDELDRVLGRVEALEAGGCIFSCPQEVAHTLGSLYRLKQLTRVHIVANSLRSDPVLLLDRRVGPVFAELNKNAICRKVAVWLTLLTGDLVEFTMRGQLLRAVKELSAAGGKVNVLESQNPDIQSLSESIVFFEGPQPLCAVSLNTKTDGKCVEAELASNSSRLQEAVITVENLLKAADLAEMRHL